MTKIEDHLTRAARELRQDVDDGDVDAALFRVTRRHGIRARSRGSRAPLLVAAAGFLVIVAVAGVVLTDDPNGERSVVADDSPPTATDPPSTATAGPTDVAFVLLGMLSTSQAPGSMVYAGVDRALADQWGVVEAGPPPTVDFDRQVVLIFTTTQEDGCHEQFVALSRDSDTSVRPVFSPPPVTSCPPQPRATHSYFVAVERADLPPRFTLMLAAAVNSSYPEQRLEIDLSSNFASSTPPLPEENPPVAEESPVTEDPPTAEDPPPVQQPPQPPEADAAEPAVWTINEGDPPNEESQTFRARVSALRCGPNTEVLEPRLAFHEDEVVVTFAVSSLPPGIYTCVGQGVVEYVVDLGEPIGQRDLIDGTCQTGEIVPSYCIDGATRWQHEAS